MTFDTTKFIKDKIEEEEEWKKKFSQGKIKITLDELGANDSSAFLKVTPEHKCVLEKPYCGQQHRMQDLRVTKQWVNRNLSTFIFLPDKFTRKEQIIDYFGDSINIVADYCVETPHIGEPPPLLPMMSEPEDYLNKPESIDLYKPLFKRLHETNKPIVFANRMEDCLAYSRYGIDWKTLKKRDIKYYDNKAKEWKYWNDEQIDKHPGFVKGHLPVKTPANYLRERICWLQILDLEDLANDIIRLVLIDEDITFACELAFLFHTLITGPIFYSHKTTNALHGPFDTNQLLTIGKSYVERILQQRTAQTLTYTAVIQSLIMLIGMIAFNWLNYPPELKYYIPEQIEAHNTMFKILLNNPEGLSIFDGLNQATRRHVQALGAEKEKDAETTSKEILQFREKLIDFQARKFPSCEQIMQLPVRFIPIVGSQNKSDDLQTKYFTNYIATAPNGKELLKNLDRFLESKWPKKNYVSNPIVKYQPDFRIYDLSALTIMSNG